MLFEVRKSDIKNVAPRSPTPAKEMEINTKSKKAKKHKNKNSQETVHIRDLKKEGPQHDQFNYHWSCLGLCFYCFYGLYPFLSQQEDSLRREAHFHQYQHPPQQGHSLQMHICEEEKIKLKF